MIEQRILLPKAITKGARLGFFSPSDPIYPRRIEFIKNATSILSNWGYKPEEITDQRFEEWSVLRSPATRAQEFHEKLVDNNIDCLMASWGGKNSSDLLTYLDYPLIRKIKKPIVGSSDINVLLNAITHKSGLITFYGPNVLGKLNQTEEIGLPLLLKSKTNTYNIFPPSSNNKLKILRTGSCVGRLVGGSLGTFTLGLSGTQFMPVFEKAIFFFETASLDYFRIRQHLQHLNNTKFLRNIVGLIVGVTNQITDGDINLFENMLLELLPNDIPIVTTELFGHGFYYNPTFPIGARMSMDTEKSIFEIERA
ncbi:LD-carboxypeptidase [Dyadobacter sp. CY343]|uniref:S66 peptidase family protein n=1 Tax=Dyadobacter sp. CY343 TaxID=2907299 RepID=UPI001F2C45F9|nr:LD-carboxypeptidase [Dyadobacter sp. CY343]MCE7062359.1 LD-carboxypeptidase [Dyadobacter sp. CY343]